MKVTPDEHESGSGDVVRDGGTVKMGVSAPVVMESRELVEPHYHAEPEERPDVCVRHFVEHRALS